jgi:hypothetical protein
MSRNEWDGMAVEFRVSDAGVVAILENGGAVQAMHLDLVIQDGRSPVWYGPDDDHDEPRSRLEYRCMVGMEGPPSEQIESHQGIVHIDGTHENGRRLTIRGVAWIGRDQDDRIEILFDEPPEMIFYEEDEEDEEGGSIKHDPAPQSADIVTLRPSRSPKAATLKARATSGAIVH